MESVPRRQGLLANHTFPVYKSDGVSARIVCDAIINNHNFDLPTTTALPRLEDVSDTWMFFDGGVEYDAIAWYHQFILDQEIRWLFGTTMGSLRLQYTVMPQGFAAATRIAQQALDIITDHAYANLPLTVGPRAWFNYIDNHCRMNRRADDAQLRARFDDATHEVNADFGSLQDWSPIITFIGSTMTIDQHNNHTVGLKPRWAQRASAYLHAAAHAAIAPMHTVAGVAVWSNRVLRAPLADLYHVLDDVRHERTAPSPDARTELRACHILASAPRTLPQLPTHIIPIAIDATPNRIAAVAWDAVPFIEPTSFPPMTNPFARAATRVCSNIDTTQPTPATVHANNIPHTRINLAELLAFALAIHHASPRTLLAIQSDSKTALRWIRQGIAPTKAASTIISYIAKLASNKHIRITTTWIPGAINPADIFTCSSRSSGDTRTGRINVKYQIINQNFRMTTWA